MANNTYVVDLLATGIETVTVTDDGSGFDWITVQGVYSETVEINLEWSTDPPISAEGSYFTTGNIGHRLIVNGVIEGAIGCNGVDFIQGNSLGNTIYGDQLRDGTGGNDTLWGASGDDLIYGGSGRDEISGGNDNDTLFGATPASIRSMGAAVLTISTVGPGRIVLLGGGDDTGMGGAGNDLIKGQIGDDVLDGNRGADRLVGGGGRPIRLCGAARPHHRNWPTGYDCRLSSQPA